MSATNASIPTFDTAAIISRWHIDPIDQWRQAQNAARFIKYFIIPTADLSVSLTVRTYAAYLKAWKLLNPALTAAQKQTYQEGVTQ